MSSKYLVLAKSRWNRSGRVRLLTGESNFLWARWQNDTITPSAASSNNAREICKEPQEVSPVNTRLLNATFYTWHFKMLAMQYYASTNEISVDENLDSYKQLEDFVDKVPQHDLLFLFLRGRC